MRDATLKYTPLIGKKFGRLTILSLKEGGPGILALCLCDCGNKTTPRITHIIINRTTSCGCIHDQRIVNASTKHGHAKRGHLTAGYWSWAGMKARCLNKNNKAYKWYGNIGVTICDRWRHSFKNFIEDMGQKPSLKHSIDRINCNGNYEPSNCKWATPQEQSTNKRRRCNG